MSTRHLASLALVLALGAAAKPSAPVVDACRAGSDDACIALFDAHAGAAGGADALAREIVSAELQKQQQQAPPPKRGESECSAGDARACAALAAALAGDDVKTLEKRRGLRRLACAFGDWFSCNDLTVLHRDALGEKASLKRFGAACARDDGKGIAPGSDCYSWGLRLATKPNASDADRALAMQAYQRACALGWGTGCYSVAAQLSLQPGANIAVVGALLAEGCDKGSPHACELREVPRKELDAACGAGDTLSCAALKMPPARGAKPRR